MKQPALLILALVHTASAQLVTSGQTSSTACTKSSGMCSNTGSDNYITRSLTYDTSTGIFTGTIVTNTCPNLQFEVHSGVRTGGGSTATCVQQTFPAPSYSDASMAPFAAPIRGLVGYSMYGVSIYGPFDNGFTNGSACSNNLGTCSSGTDVGICEDSLKYQCGTAYLPNVMPDDCGGHANPYHYHIDMDCEYDTTAAGHSTLVALALDGRGIYGMYESTGKTPTDLDACNGHYGPVPARTIGGVTYPAASNVYHYHVTATAPFTVGCYGPATSISQCKKLYKSTCDTGYTNITGNTTCMVNYDLDCPCFRQGTTETYNQASVSDCYVLGRFQNTSTLSFKSSSLQLKSISIHLKLAALILTVFLFQ